jgi:hypothetical protein
MIPLFSFSKQRLDSSSIVSRLKLDRETPRSKESPGGVKRTPNRVELSRPSSALPDGDDIPFGPGPVDVDLAHLSAFDW